MAQVIIIVQHDMFAHYVFLTKDDNFHLLDVPMLCVCLMLCAMAWLEKENITDLKGIQYQVLNKRLQNVFFAVNYIFAYTSKIVYCDSFHLCCLFLIIRKDLCNEFEEPVFV